MSKIKLPHVSKADALRHWLGKGQRVKAAEYAREYARNASPDELREIIAALAGVLEDIGDAYKGQGPGRRPKLDPENVTLRAVRAENVKQRQMRRAADLHGDLIIAAYTLANRYANAADKARARDVLEPTGLIPGRTFKTRARAYAAKKLGVVDSELREFLKN